MSNSLPSRDTGGVRPLVKRLVMTAHDPERRTVWASEPKPLNGERLARHFGIRMTSVVSVQGFSVDPLVITRLQGETCPDATTGPVDPEPAFSIVVQLGMLQHHELRIGGRLRHAGSVPVGAVSAISLEDTPRSSMSGFFDALQFYVPHAFFDDLATEEGFSRPPGLTWPRAQPDPVVASLAALLLPAIQEPDTALSLFIEHITLAFLGHAAQRYGQARAPGDPVRSGLAPWQERRAKELMRSRLGTSLSMAEVSRECRLSPSYFAAAFRRSTGLSPHQFLSSLRVDEAKALMLSTSLPLDDIASLCGFSNQSYFTRMFSKFSGISPGQWRRLHATG